MCTCNLATIARECGRNAPGMTTTLEVACVDDIATIGAAVNHEVATVTMVATKKFFRVNATRKDNDSKSTPQENGGFTTEAKYFISKQAAEKAKVFTTLPSDENFVAHVTDQNGYSELLGNLTHPVTMRVEAVKTPKNGYNLTIVWDGHADLPYHFTGDISPLL